MGCTGWTVTNNNECYLKTSVGTCRAMRACRAAATATPAAGTSRTTRTTMGTTTRAIQVQNAEFCKVRCQASGGQCKGWTVTNNGECYLKDSVGPMRPDGGVQASGNC